jgi:hypothetical protein
MTEPRPQYQASTAARGHDATTLPQRAVNLARRMLELERQCSGRGRVSYEIIMLDGEWLLMVSKPGPVERLGE